MSEILLIVFVSGVTSLVVSLYLARFIAVKFIEFVEELEGDLDDHLESVDEVVQIAVDDLKRRIDSYKGADK